MARPPWQYLGKTLATTRIQLCGRLVARVGARRIENELPGRQGRLLFVFLVLNRLRPVARAELAEALWPNGAPAAPDSALSALLSKTRRAVAIEGRSEIALALPADAWIDVEVAGEALHRAETAVATGDWAGAWSPARVAQHIAARRFLPGEDAPWAVEQRDRIEETYLRALELAAAASFGIGGRELETAERAARTLVARTPLRESGYRLLMEILERRGNRAEALTVYDRLRIHLREELGVPPSAATQAVHRRLLG